MTVKNSITLISMFLTLGSFDTPITGIEITTHFDFVNPVSKEVLQMDKKTEVFYSNGLILYRFPIYVTKEHQKDKDNAVVFEIQDSISRYEYMLVDSKNPNTGFFYNSLKEDYRSVAVDSLLQKQLGYNEKMFLDENDRLVKSVKNKGENTLLEKYVPKVKFDDSYADTTLLYFSSSISSPFSFSKKLDKPNGLKLIEAAFIYNALLENNQVTIPRRELRFKVSSITPNKNEIAPHFIRYKEKIALD